MATVAVVIVATVGVTAVVKANAAIVAGVVTTTVADKAAAATVADKAAVIVADKAAASVEDNKTVNGPQSVSPQSQTDDWPTGRLTTLMTYDNVTTKKNQVS